MLYLFLAAVLIMLASLAGVFFTWKAFRKLIEPRLPLLVSLSAGVFSIVVYNLLREVREESGTVFMVVSVGAGVVLALLLFRYIPFFHHHHSGEKEGESEKKHTHEPLDVRRILFGDAVHNIGDGVLLTAAFAASPAVGFAATLGIFFHELVQEVSEFFVLREGGVSTRRALVVNLLISSTIFLGILLALVVTRYVPIVEPFLLALSAGIFLVVLLFDLLPHSVRNALKADDYLPHLVFFFLGVGMMLLINTLSPFAHSHEHSESEVDHHEEELLYDPHDTDNY